jgi:hypothetical protein
VGRPGDPLPALPPPTTAIRSRELENSPIYRTKVEDDREFWVQVGISIAVLILGFTVLVLGLGRDTTATLAAGWVGTVIGFWLA